MPDLFPVPADRDTLVAHLATVHCLDYASVLSEMGARLAHARDHHNDTPCRPHEHTDAGR